MSSLSNTQINTRSMNGLVNVEANSGSFDDIECNTINIAVQGNSPTAVIRQFNKNSNNGVCYIAVIRQFCRFNN